MSLRSILPSVVLTALTLAISGCGGKESFSPFPRIGISTYAALHPNFPCHEVIKLHAKIHTPAIVVVWGTFGESIYCLQHLINFSITPPLVEIHPWEENCRKHDRCHDGALAHHLSVDELNKALEERNLSLLEEIRMRLIKINLAVTLLGISNLYVSTGLEDQYTQEAFEVVASQIKASLSAKIVRSPLSNYCPPGSWDVCEVHGIVPKQVPCIANNDGHKLDAKILEESLHCDAVFLWDANLQGYGIPFVPPKKRQFILTDSFGKIVNEFVERIALKMP